MNTNRECCYYGRLCYRTSAIHRSEYSHPGDVDYIMTGYHADRSISLPPCRYADKCVRRNPIHFREYSHPSKVPDADVQDTIRLETLDISLSTADIQPIASPRQSMSSQSDNLHRVSLLESSESSTNSTLIGNLEAGDAPTYRARVVIKSDIHPYTGGSGSSGVMLTVNLLDRTGEIRLVAFGPFCRYLFDSIEVDQVFDFSHFTVKQCDLKQGVSPIPELAFNVQPLEIVDSMQKNEMLDIVAICQSYGNVQDILLRNNVPGKKRELCLVDQTGTTMLTIWGSNAEKFDKICEPGCVVAFKRARVSDYGGGSLDSSCLSSSTFKVDPNIPEALTLKYWFKTTALNK